MKYQFQITGMTCAACSARVEKVSAGVPGVQKAEVNLLKGTMTLEADSQAVVPAVIEAVKKAGYGASISGGSKQNTAPAEDPLITIASGFTPSVSALSMIKFVALKRSSTAICIALSSAFTCATPTFSAPLSPRR